MFRNSVISTRWGLFVFLVAAIVFWNRERHGAWALVSNGPAVAHYHVPSAQWASYTLTGPTNRMLSLAKSASVVDPFSVCFPLLAGSRRSTHGSPTQLHMWGRDDEDIGGGMGNRIKCCFPYLLPLIDGDHFGYFIYQRIPVLGLINEVLLGPLVQLNINIPFFGLAFFLAMTLGTRFNTDMDRNLRYNAQQAALIDIALIFPELIASGIEEGDVPRSIAEPCSNFVWYAYMSAVVYSVYSNLRGKKPSGIPFLSESAEWMVGPF